MTLTRSGKKGKGSSAVLHVRQAQAWTVANWLVAHAQDYGLSQVRYAGYAWKAANGSMGWQRAVHPDIAVREQRLARRYCRWLIRHPAC